MLLEELIKKTVFSRGILSYHPIVKKINALKTASRPVLFFKVQDVFYMIELERIKQPINQEILDSWFILNRIRQDRTSLTYNLEPTPYLLKQSYVREATGIDLLQLSTT